MDYIFAAVSRVQSKQSFAIDEVENILQEQKKIDRFLRYFSQTNGTSDGGARHPFPASYEDTLSYIRYLSRGAYFLTKGTVLSYNNKTVIPFLACRGFLDQFGDTYRANCGSNFFDDLRKDSDSKILGQGEVVFWNNGNNYAFTLNDTIIIQARVLRRNHKNRQKRKQALKQNFSHLKE